MPRQLLEFYQIICRNQSGNWTKYLPELHVYPTPYIFKSEVQDDRHYWIMHWKLERVRSYGFLTPLSTMFGENQQPATSLLH